MFAQRVTFVCVCLHTWVFPASPMAKLEPVQSSVPPRLLGLSGEVSLNSSSQKHLQPGPTFHSGPRLVPPPLD